MRRRLDEIEIGGWYAAASRPERFEVVAIDDTQRAVEIQYYDGTVAEVDFESWPLLEAEEAPPADDCSGAFDNNSDAAEALPPDGPALAQRIEDHIDQLDQFFY